MGHISIEEDVPRMVELSYHYKIQKDTPITERVIYGVEGETDCWYLNWSQK